MLCIKQVYFSEIVLQKSVKLTNNEATKVAYLTHSLFTTLFYKPIIIHNEFKIILMVSKT